jgi:hypothetical protein
VVASPIDNELYVCIQSTNGTHDPSTHKIVTGWQTTAVAGNYNFNFPTPLSSSDYGILPNSGTLYWGKDAWTWTYKSSNNLRNCNTTLTTDLPPGGVLNWQWRKLVEATFQNNPTHTAITTTTIDGGNITTGSITADSAVLGDAAVETLKIAGNAVTVSDGGTAIIESVTTGASITLPIASTPVAVRYIVQASFYASGSSQRPSTGQGGTSGSSHDSWSTASVTVPSAATNVKSVGEARIFSTYGTSGGTARGNTTQTVFFLMPANTTGSQVVVISATREGTHANYRNTVAGTFAAVVQGAKR